MKKRTVLTAGIIGAIVSLAWRRRVKNSPAGVIKELTDAERDQLPHYCFTMTGIQTEPVNILFVGSRDGILEYFLAAGWFEADPTTPKNLIKAIGASILNRAYKEWPMTPYVINGEVQSLALQKGLDSDNHRGRHHLRIWPTALKLGNQQIWAGAASAEMGVKFTTHPLFITHRLNPDLDAEREFIVDDLVRVGVKASGMIKLAGQLEGTNVFGDSYRTDGRAAVLAFDYGSGLEEVNHAA